MLFIRFFLCVCMCVCWLHSVTEKLLDLNFRRLVVRKGLRRFSGFMLELLQGTAAASQDPAE